MMGFDSRKLNILLWQTWFLLLSCVLAATVQLWWPFFVGLVTAVVFWRGTEPSASSFKEFRFQDPLPSGKTIDIKSPYGDRVYHVRRTTFTYSKGLTADNKYRVGFVYFEYNAVLIYLFDRWPGLLDRLRAGACRWRVIEAFMVLLGVREYAGQVNVSTVETLHQALQNEQRSGGENLVQLVCSLAIDGLWVGSTVSSLTQYALKELVQIVAACKEARDES